MLKYLLMALLAERPRHGYELKRAFEELAGGTWVLNVGQIYVTLSRLEDDGLIAAEVVHQEPRDVADGLLALQGDPALLADGRRATVGAHDGDDVRQREAVEGVTRGLLGKLLHGPTVRLKEAAGTARGERLADALRELFEL